MCTPHSKSPRVFVGTLACGEAEFEEATLAIERQEGVVVEHEVIRDIPELEAHQALLGQWNQRRADFDLFVKVDADTVLSRPTALREIWALFDATPDVTGAQIGLHDYFGDCLVAGLNAFSPAVSFDLPDDALFCDRVTESGHQRVLKPADTEALYPIGWHCKNPHPQQAFHCGYRRLLKGQGDMLRAMITAWRLKGGKDRLWALMGARAAFFKRLDEASYSNPEFKSLYAQQVGIVESGAVTPEIIARDLDDILETRFSVRIRRLANNLISRVP